MRRLESRHSLPGYTLEGIPFGAQSLTQVLAAALLGWPATEWETGPEPKMASEMAGSHFSPGHLRPVFPKPVGRIFEISDSKPIRGKRGKCGKSLSPQKNKGLQRFRRAKNEENAENADAENAADWR